MKIGVVGLWHLGTVYSACLASLGNKVIGIDEDSSVINGLNNGKLPVEEPGILELIQSSKENSLLSFSTNLGDVADCEIVWITVDTPVNDSDEADHQSVINLINTVIPHLMKGAILAISSQLPAGSSNKISNANKEKIDQNHIAIAYIPENLRLGKALGSFKEQNPWIIGTSEAGRVSREIGSALKIPENQMLVMSAISAEFVKHSINAFLAVSVIFANEIGRISIQYGANPNDVMRAVMSDPRIGQKAYLKPGKPIEGGTLARDVVYLQSFSQNYAQIPAIQNIIQSNEHHKNFIIEKIRNAGKENNSKRIAILGLGYKQDSSAMRRSHGIEIAEELVKEGYKVSVFDDFMDINAPLNSSLQLLNSFDEYENESDVIYWNLHESFSAINKEGLPKKIIIDGNNLFQESKIVTGVERQQH